MQKNFSHFRFISKSSWILFGLSLLNTYGTCVKFKRQVFCGGTAKINKRCLTAVTVEKFNLLKCARLCSSMAACEGFGLFSEVCYISTHCPVIITAMTCNANFTYYKKWPEVESCLNGGLWFPENGSCTCYGGFVGLSCERYAVSCRELLEYGYPRHTRLPFYIQPQGLTTPHLTECALLDLEVRTDLFIRMQNDNFRYNRTMAEYVQGFYNGSDEFWIGLEKMHNLNTVLHLDTMVLLLGLGQDTNSHIFYGVRIGDASTDYTISFQNATIVDPSLQFFNLSAANCLPPNISTPFSTPNDDNDLEPAKNCAGIAGAGWWFSTCSPKAVCNPLGSVSFNASSDQAVYYKGIYLNKFPAYFTYFRMYFTETLM